MIGELMSKRNLFCSITGIPNMGKSTLLNKLIGFDLAIISPKAETTRSRITGVITIDDVQYVFLDTPGYNRPKTKLDQHLVKTVRESLSDSDCILFLTYPKDHFLEYEQKLLDEFKGRDIPVILCINKCDTVTEEIAAQNLESLMNLYDFSDGCCISALTGEGIDHLMEILKKYSVEGEHYFPDDTLTDIPEKYVVAELIRERLLFNLRDELPHGCAVEVMQFKERPDKDLVDIDVNIYCERESHKGMIIGKRGSMLKKIASEARQKIEDFLECKVNLQCWVKVRDDWRNSDFALKDLGF